MFIVISGAVRIRPSHRATVELPHTVRDGAVIGLAAAIDGERWPYSCALEAASPVVMWRIPGELIADALQEWGELHGTSLPSQVRQLASGLVKHTAIYVPPANPVASPPRAALNESGKKQH